MDCLYTSFIIYGNFIDNKSLSSSNGYIRLTDPSIHSSYLYFIGSGVPELKSLLSGGVHIKYFLSIRALLVKVLGLSLALGSGAILGKEGPFVHLSSVVGKIEIHFDSIQKANQLSRIPLFERIKTNERLMHIMLGAACATGVASHFGNQQLVTENPNIKIIYRSSYWRSYV
jgi:chloride channel 2